MKYWVLERKADKREYLRCRYIAKTEEKALERFMELEEEHKFSSEIVENVIVKVILRS